MLCDKDKIIQVLINLVNNAVKFTDKGSVMIITKSAKNLAQVSIKDTGSGMNKEDLPQLFQQFVQLHVDLSKTLGGTGLGLVICKEIIEAHRGKIWVESESGKGTVINFILPVEEQRA